MDEESDGRGVPNAAELLGRPGLRFLQRNIRGLCVTGPGRHIGDYISVCLLQETLVRGDCNLRFPGYVVHHLPIRDDAWGRGCQILASNSIPNRAIDRPIECGEGVENQALQLILNGTEITVYNVCCTQRGELDLVERDLNAHQEMLGKGHRCWRHLANLLQVLDNIVLLNTGEPTHVQGK